jgi:hypothetical protein
MHPCQDRAEARSDQRNLRPVLDIRLPKIED